jgi:ribonuclease Z
LVEEYPFIIDVVEIGDDSLRKASLSARGGFALGSVEVTPVNGLPLTILEDPLFTAEALLLDHHIPCAGYAISERLHVNIHRDGLEKRGLPVGEWLRDLKEKIRTGETDDTLVEIPGHESLPLGELKSDCISVSLGQKIAYIVDVAFNEENIGRILELVGDADLFFCGAPFLERDAERARETRHLTARQAGWLAREAHVKRLEVFHFSPRYEGEPESLFREAEEAYRGESEP